MGTPQPTEVTATVYADHVQIGGRDLGLVTKAIFERRHYHAASNMVATLQAALQMFRRYLTGAGDYPFTAQVKTPSGWLTCDCSLRTTCSR